MDRLACVSIPAFELQLLIKRFPSWQEVPAAVISEAKPLGRVIAANRSALKAGVRPDMRYAQALSLRPDLQAAVIARQDRLTAQEEIIALLYEFAPTVESARFAHSTMFWLDVRGLSRLYRSYTQWGEQLLESLKAFGFLGACAIGWSRLGTFAAAQKPGAVRLFDTPEEEAKATRGTAVRYLPIAPFVKERLTHLGIRTVEEFLQLPKGGVRSRFGTAVEGIYAISAQGEGVPVQGSAPREPNRIRRVCMPSLRRVTPILENIGELLREVSEGSRRRLSRIRSITVRLRDESGAVQVEELTPAEPTRDYALLRKLCELRLSRLSWKEPVEEIVIEAEEEESLLDQQELFIHPPKRRPERGRRALSLLQARLGSDSVLRAELQDSHLPEGSFLWHSFEVQRLGRASLAGSLGASIERAIQEQDVNGSRFGGEIQLVRRFLRSSGDNRGAGRAKGSSKVVGGPYVVSTRWWLTPVEREYHYRELEDGTVEWSYYDPERRVWTLLGSVE